MLAFKTADAQSQAILIADASFPFGAMMDCRSMEPRCG
jgi:hypothetical protein